MVKLCTRHRAENSRQTFAGDRDDREETSGEIARATVEAAAATIDSALEEAAADETAMQETDIKSASSLLLYVIWEDFGSGSKREGSFLF